MSILSQKHFHDEAEAYKHVEAIIWGNDRNCPHCGVIGRSAELKGKSTRIGVYKCYECRKPFTVKVGTIFEDSHIKMHIWLQAIHLMSSSKKGFSASQFSRVLGISVKSAWFMAHRIREAMTDKSIGAFGEGGGYVEADETYYGPKKEKATKRTSGEPFKYKSGGIANKRAVVSLVERGGVVKSFHVDRADKATVASIVVQNVSKEAHLLTDESRLYSGADAHVASHSQVHHSKGEYVRGQIHTNTIESYFSTFKRGMKGTYQHCDEKHLHRYLAEFDFRYNNRVALEIDDTQRSINLLKGAVGKRLMYKISSAGTNEETLTA